MNTEQIIENAFYDFKVGMDKDEIRMRTQYKNMMLKSIYQ